jgi:hypothetical protein
MTNDEEEEQKNKGTKEQNTIQQPRRPTRLCQWQRAQTEQGHKQ